MVIAYHLIISAYGYWLPNDPRGSWSTWIRKWELFRYGPATKVTTRRSLADRPHDYQLRQEAKQALTYPPVIFTGHQALAIIRGFSHACTESGYRVHACAILPDHAHLVVGRKVGRTIEKIGGHLKARATQQLIEERLDPFDKHVKDGDERPSPWSHGRWKVFIDSEQQVRNATGYVEHNPEKEGKKRQQWDFVIPWTVDEIERVRRELREQRDGDGRGKPRR